MKRNTYQDLTKEQLVKKMNSLKGALMGFGIVVVLAIAILLYLFVTNKSGKLPIAVLIPVLVLPVTFTPLLIALGQLNKEIRNRN